MKRLLNALAAGLQRWRRRIDYLRHRTQMEREMDEEILIHVAMEAEDNLRRGLSPEEAKRRALLAFGGVERYKEEARHARGTRWFEDLAGDFRHALRQLRRNPSFTVVAVLTLALGIGANSAIFSAVNAVLLEPLPYPEPDRLVFIYSEVPAWGPGQVGLSVSEYRELQDLSRSFSEIGAYRIGSVNLSGTESPVRVTAARATVELFAALGISPRLGRVFNSEEDTGARAVAVISSSLWRSAFGTDPEIVGREIELDGRSTTVVGVMPDGFDIEDADVDVWLPAGVPIDPPTRGSHPLRVAGRLAPGLTIGEARTELEVLLTEWGELKPSWHSPNDSTHRLGLEGLHGHVVGDVRAALLILMGAVGLVLLIACSNVANLLLVRAEGRQREIAVRAAMGAGRRRLIRQFLTESVILGSAGGAVGLLVGGWGLRALLAASPGSVPRADSIGLELPVLFFTLAVAVLASVLFGLAPLSHLRAGAMAATLKESARSTAGAGRQRLRRLLVVTQVALAVVLVIGSGLLLRSFGALLDVDPGFEPAGLLTFELSLPATRYPDGVDRLTFLDALIRRLEAIPGVESATAMNGLPPVRGGNETEAEFEGVPETPDGPHHSFDYVQMVTSDYFETMGIPIVAGRAFDEGDDAQATPVAIINEALARTFYPGDNPLGRRLRVSWDVVPWFTIVGVAEDVKQGGLSEETGTEVYYYYPQATAALWAPQTMNVVVRSSGLPPLSFAEETRQAVHSLDPSLPVARLQTMEAHLAGSIDRPRFLALLLSIFAGVGLALAAVGTYGVLTYSVARRRSEIGIRMALGAGTDSVLGIVLLDGLVLTALGLALGLMGALGLSRLLSSLLFGISNTDPVTYVVAPALLAAVALAACWIPAHRATRVDPMVALRCE